MEREPSASAPAGDEQEKAVSYVYSQELHELLSRLRLSLFVTSYQAQRLMCFSAGDAGRMSMLMRIFPKPMGLAVKPNRMALCCRNQVWFFRTASEVRDLQGNELPYDLVFVPRHSHVTGDIAAHQLTWADENLLIVNTRFSCICSLDPAWSFVPLWKPPFVTEIVPEDRCHLNGFCLNEKGPKYATALGKSNQKEGWRPDKARGGVLIDIPSGDLVAAELSMPHTPLLHAGKLWILESGTGRLLLVDQRNGQITTAAELPGFLRGLAFYDRFAFIGLSKIREKRTFGGLPIEGKISSLKCGIFVLDIMAGKIAGFIEFTKGVEELFDIQVLIGPRNPHIIGFEEDTIDGLMVVPPGLLAQKGS